METKNLELDSATGSGKEMSIQDKGTSLENIIRKMGSILIAYSGGVDSTFLAVIANDILGDKVLMVTAQSPSLAPNELQEAKALAERFGFRHRIIQTNEFSNPDYLANGPRRCYFCKIELHTQLKRLASEEDFKWVASGVNVDDLLDFRPGLAASKEFGVRNPLVEAALNKEDIRTLSRYRGLPTWDKPPQACLSSRLPAGTTVTVEALTQIARAEELIRELGLRHVRVRHHGSLARIEVPVDDLPSVTDHRIREAIVARLVGIGYLYVTVDLAGYRAGSSNAVFRRKVSDSSVKLNL